MQGAAVSIISAITVIIVTAFIIFYYGLAHLLCKEKCSLTFPDNQPVPLFKTILGKSRVYPACPEHISICSELLCVSSTHA